MNAKTRITMSDTDRTIHLPDRLRTAPELFEQSRDENTALVYAEGLFGREYAYVPVNIVVPA